MSKDGKLAGFHDFLPPAESFRDAVLQGLAQPAKAIGSKFIYDAEGSHLFEAIPTLDEYYQTRTEIALLKAHAAEIADKIGPRCYLVDYGSGTGEKNRILLDALDAPAAFVPLDISADHLRQHAQVMAAAYAGVAVHAVAADFLGHYELPDVPCGKRLGFFPGSTIGNFSRDEADRFLAHARTVLDGGNLLIGIDLKKSVAVMEAAYNDSRGVSSAFNLNLLGRINRELEGDIDVAQFRHHAVYDAKEGCMAIGIRSTVDQDITVLGQRFAFREDEVLHTQHAYKFTPQEFSAIAGRAGFETDAIWIDDDRLYALIMLDASET